MFVLLTTSFEDTQRAKALFRDMLDALHLRPTKAAVTLGVTPCELHRRIAETGDYHPRLDDVLALGKPACAEVGYQLLELAGEIPSTNTLRRECAEKARKTA